MVHDWRWNEEQVTEMSIRQRVYYPHHYNTGDYRYRIYGRWTQGEGYRYRAEYELPTGWWPVSQHELLRDAKAAVNEHAKKRTKAARTAKRDRSQL